MPKDSKTSKIEELSKEESERRTTARHEQMARIDVGARSTIQEEKREEALAREFSSSLVPSNWIVTVKCPDGTERKAYMFDIKGEKTSEARKEAETRARRAFARQHCHVVDSRPMDKGEQVTE